MGSVSRFRLCAGHAVSPCLPIAIDPTPTLVYHAGCASIQDVATAEPNIHRGDSSHKTAEDHAMDGVWRHPLCFSCNGHPPG